MWFPRRTASQPSIQQDENGKKKRKKEKKGKKTRASGETVKTLDQLAVAHSSKDQPQALGVLINILDMSKEEKQCVLFY